MIVYNDMSYCVRHCGNLKCCRNRMYIPWDTLLPVAFIKCAECVNWKVIGNKTKDLYMTEEVE